VSASDISQQIRDRAAHASLDLAPPVVDSLAAYVALLARWNRRINLTALPLDPPTDVGIDRLLVEPLVAARLLTPADRVVLDIGSGGGSPALPMKIASPACRFVLVEVRDRKSAFLREAIRHLQLADTTVETARLEDLPLQTTPVDVLTLRAVRIDTGLVEAMRRLLRTGGRLLWFRSETDDRDDPTALGLTVVAEHAPIPGSTSRVFETKIA
jgi:16S rRNA (guanine527-N7)-methyltransferase